MTAADIQKRSAFSFSYNSEIIMNVTDSEMKWTVNHIGDAAPTPLATDTEIPEFVRPLVLQLVGELHLPKRIALEWNYVALGDKVVLFYDTIHADDVPLVSARVDWLPLEDFDRGVLDEYTMVHRVQYKSELPQWIRKAGRVSLKMDLTRYSLDKANHTTTIEGHLNVICTRHPLGELANVLMLPEFPPLEQFPKHAIVLGSETRSEFVWRNLSDLSRALAGKGSKIVFLRGEPGSGKEVYANAFHYGSFRKKRSPFVQRAVAGMDASSLRRELFGRVEGAHEIPGKIAEAVGGTLFLDEFDKLAESKSYGELLRVLEAGVYFPDDGKSERKADDLNWVLAGAFSVGNTGAHSIDALPKDIWSRFTHEINLQNPLEDVQCGKEYLASLYRYWIVREAIDSCPGQSIREKFERLLTHDGYFLGICRHFIFDKSTPVNPFQVPKIGKVLTKLSTEFAKYSGKYHVYIYENNGSTSSFVQKVWRDHRDTYEFTGTPDHRDKEEDLRSVAKNFFAKSRPANEVNVIEKENYDGIRAVRQAAKQAFQLAIETGIKKGPDYNIHDIIVDLMEASLKSIHLAREGVSLADDFCKIRNCSVKDPKNWRKTLKT